MDTFLSINKRIFTAVASVVIGLTLASCSGMSVGVGVRGDGYYRPRGYYAIDPYYLYDGYWHDGYCYYNDGWYYHGYDTPYYYLYDPYDPFYW